jgi:hypothetical protein
VLNSEQSSAFVCTNHEWEVSGLRRGAGVFTAEINEIGASLIRPVRFIDPVALLEGTLTMVIVIYVVFKPQLRKIVVVNVRQGISVDRGKDSPSGSHRIK